MSQEEEEERKLHKRLKRRKNEFIDDEAELSGDDEVSDDELELSDDDQLDPDLVDQDAKELDSDEEEEVRRLYHKQLESEDKRAVLLLQEQLEDNDVAVGQRRRRKFRWQTKELMENSLRRHYDPDDDDSQGVDDEEDDDDDFDYSELNPRLRRPTAEAILIASTKTIRKADLDDSNMDPPRMGSSSQRTPATGGPVASISDDSNSTSRLTAGTMRANTSTKTSSDLSRFVFRDKEVVEALSTKETVVVTREEKDRVIQREIKRVLQSKSIFDQLYS